MPEEEFSSLFDLASKKKKKEEQISAPAVPQEIKSDEDVKNVFTRYKKIHDEIKETLESAFEKAHVSPKQVEEFFSEPQRFETIEWRAINATKNEVKKKLENLLPKKEEKTAEQEEKVKKTKGGFISKKRWLSMH